MPKPASAAPIIGVHFALLRAGAVAATHAVSMFEAAHSKSHDACTRTRRDAMIVAHAGALALRAAAEVADLTEYVLAVDYGAEARGV